MNKNTRYVEFIDKLCESTENKKFLWSYLDDKPEAMDIFRISRYKAVIPNPRLHTEIPFRGKYYKADISFCAQYKENAVLLLNNIKGELCLIVTVSSSLRNAIILDDSIYGTELVRLLAKVKKQFPDPENFIDKILKGDFSDEV